MGESVSVSVAMATYNGARHLESQLASLAAQNRPPIELVVSDDGSSDDTVAIVERFASRAAFEVRILEDRGHLGFAENFLRAARACRGDLLAWSDQDDVWMPTKLERCAHEFEADLEVRLVVHSRWIGDWVRRGRLVARGGVKGRSSPLECRRKVFNPATLPLEYAAPGFASLLDRRVLELGDSLGIDLPGEFGDYGHDSWTAFLAGALGKVVFLPDVLVRYRQHLSNVFGAPEAESSAVRVRASARRETASFADHLIHQAARSTFRATALDRLANLTGADGPARRAAMWKRRAEVRRRRLEIYSERLARRKMVKNLLRDMFRGDYGRRSTGGLGGFSLVRDVYHAVRGHG